MWLLYQESVLRAFLRGGNKSSWCVLFFFVVVVLVVTGVPYNES